MTAGSEWHNSCTTCSHPTPRVDGGRHGLTDPHPVVFLVDVDNTLLDNDAIQEDLQRRLELAFGSAVSERYWSIQEDLFAELGYRDYIGALQRLRGEHPHCIELLSIASFLMEYPFPDRLFPGAIDVLEQLRHIGQTVIVSDGDVVFQPRKIERAGLSRAAEGHVLVYIHKEEALSDVERRYPARHYVFIDDKLRILDAAKRYWGERVTTVFPRQGRYARNLAMIRAYRSADVTIEQIADLLHAAGPWTRTAAADS